MSGLVDPGKEAFAKVLVGSLRAITPFLLWMIWQQLQALTQLLGQCLASLGKQ